MVVCNKEQIERLLDTLDYLKLNRINILSIKLSIGLFNYLETINIVDMKMSNGYIFTTLFGYPFYVDETGNVETFEVKLGAEDYETLFDIWKENNLQPILNNMFNRGE